jgi:hypothetical protein
LEACYCGDKLAVRSNKSPRNAILRIFLTSFSVGRGFRVTPISMAHLLIWINFFNTTYRSKSHLRNSLNGCNLHTFIFRVLAAGYSSTPGYSLSLMKKYMLGSASYTKPYLLPAVFLFLSSFLIKSSYKSFVVIIFEYPKSASPLINFISPVHNRPLT